MGREEASPHDLFRSIAFVFSSSTLGKEGDCSHVDTGFLGTPPLD